MGFTPEIAAIRFGEGLSPLVTAPGSASDVLAQLQGADLAAEAYPIPSFADLLPQIAKVERLRRIWRKAAGKAEEAELRKNHREARAEMSRAQVQHTRHFYTRSITTEQPFRERLTRFWGDHFTVVGGSVAFRHAAPYYVEGAIRPWITGRFVDMLKAVVTHPMMLLYLDQIASFGPNSKGARGRRGLNENLARELLELHTLGVDGSYSQTDVRQLAELLTGLSSTLRDGFVFRENMAEPDAETVLGKSYGGGPANLDDIYAVLEDLAIHPDTATHLARKLAVHFTSDTPDEGMIADMAAAYLASGGALMPLYEVMLEHPFAWDSFGQKVKQPVDFVMSALRVFPVPVRTIAKMNRGQMHALMTAPMAAMGQNLYRPLGPDGWAEDAEHWVTPQGVAARLQFAMAMPSAIYRSLPDPREFVTRALGDLADERLLFAARAAETRREGVGLILASPGFQRR